MCRDFPSRQRRVRVRYGNSLVIVEISQTLLSIQYTQHLLFCCHSIQHTFRSIITMQSIPSVFRGGIPKHNLLRAQTRTCRISRHFSGTPSTTPSNVSTQAQNRNLVQSRDYESFVIGLLHPATIQPSYYALRAFHVEIASIRSKESSVASMRMKWWFDTIQSLYTSPGRSNNSSTRGNPTIMGLDQAIQSHNLTQRFLERMVETRMGDLQKGSNGRFDTMNDMITFFERTNSTFLFLNLECCGVIDEEADKVANCVGIASGIINMIRSIGCGHVGIPNDLIEKYGVQEGCIHDPTKIIAGDEEEARIAIRNSVRDMAEIAGKYLSHARLHQGDVPNEGKSAMLPAVSALRYLDRLKGVNFDVFEEKIRDVENIESLNGRFWRFGHLLYLGRAQMTGVF